MTAFFSSYIKNIITVGICAYICEWVCSVGDNTNIKKAVSFTAGLCIFVTVALPFASAVKDFTAGFDIMAAKESTDESVNTAFFDLTEEETEKRIAEELKETLGIDECKVKLELNTQNDTLKIDSLSVQIPEKYYRLNDEIKKYITQIHKDADIIYTGANNNE